MKTGDRVTLIADEREVEATVILASQNGRSLMLSFEAIIFGAVGMMPVLKEDDGSWVAVMAGQPVEIRPMVNPR
ncbi:hypothetical protein [Microvirga massiliensis]|uniref:hypothetical protein n=1 Tax=Microvirga massiliensis TaxID=1033741 RepID=UPI00062B95C9|nr:hypothetical protein [Microvirga massiliensis]